MSRNPSLIIVAAALLCLAQSGIGQAQTKKPAGGAAEHANKAVKLAQAGANEEAIAEFTLGDPIEPEGRADLQRPRPCLSQDEQIPGGDGGFFEGD